MTCATPHPVRAPGGVDLVPELEVIGSHATEAWVRCRDCGAWFWTSTDLGGKFDYVGEKPLERALAERAFLAGDARAAARLLVESDEPYGPVWTTASALIEMLRAVTPSANDRARSEALDAVPPSGRWVEAANVLREIAKHAAPTASELVFELDVRMPGRTLGDAYEIGDALVVFQDAPTAEMIRITRAGGVSSAPLPAPARFLARNAEMLLFDVDGAVFMLDARGSLTSFPKTAERFDVTALDDGWWLFVPMNGALLRGVEFHKPDVQPRAKLAMAFRASDYPCAPRRMGDGWIVSGCVDDRDDEQALTLFDASFETIAYSTGAIGQRVIAPIDAGALWCETAEPPYTLERWERRGRDLVRTLDVASQSWIRGTGYVVLSPRKAEASITGYDDSGAVRFTLGRKRRGATYFARVPRGVLVYDDRSAEVFDPITGARLVSASAIPIEGASVLEAKSGAVFLRSQNALWVFDEDPEPIRVFVGEHMRLETTCGDAAILRDRRGDCLVVGADGSIRASFRAPTARFSTVATRGGPYVVEPEHVRVGTFPR